MGEIQGIYELSPRKQKKYSTDIQEYRRDVFTMMNNRGYNQPQYVAGSVDSNAYMTLDSTFSKFNRGNPNMEFYVYNSHNSYSIPGKILLVFYLGIQIKTQEASLIITAITRHNEVIGYNENDYIRTHILISSKKIASEAMKKFKQIDTKFEPFMIDEVLDPYKMVIPFIYKVLNHEEKAELLADLGADPTDLPQFYEGSPEIKYYGIPARSILKIKHFNFYEASETPEVLDYRFIKPGDPPAIKRVVVKPKDKK